MRNVDRMTFFWRSFIDESSILSSMPRSEDCLVGVLAVFCGSISVVYDVLFV